MHVIVIALPCWYVTCIDPAFSAIFCYNMYYSFGFSYCTSILTLMNCAEKRFCEPKAVSLFCRPVLFFFCLFFSIISFLMPRRI